MKYIKIGFLLISYIAAIFLGYGMHKQQEKLDLWSTKAEQYNKENSEKKELLNDSETEYLASNDPENTNEEEVESTSQSTDTSTSNDTNPNTITEQESDKKNPNIKNIVCWGDGLTSEGGWPEILASLTGANVYNAGSNMETTKAIMARQGADTILVNDIVIPKESVPVFITSQKLSNGLPTSLGNNIFPMLDDKSTFNPVRIAGVEGKLSWTGKYLSDKNGSWIFTRSKPGEEVTISRPTPVQSVFAQEHRDDFLILYMGENGEFSTVEELIKQHRLILNHSNAENYLVLGFSSGNTEIRKHYEESMKQEFGRYFVSLREYLSEYGLVDAAIVPTQKDISFMKIGAVPPSLLKDDVHYTDKCQTLIGEFIYKKLLELGLLSDV